MQGPVPWYVPLLLLVPLALALSIPNVRFRIRTKIRSQLRRRRHTRGAEKCKEVGHDFYDTSEFAKCPFCQGQRKSLPCPACSHGYVEVPIRRCLRCNTAREPAEADLQRRLERATGIAGWTAVDLSSLLDAIRRLKRAGRHREALEIISAGKASLGEMHKELWNLEGCELHNLGRYDEALPCFDRAISLDANWPNPWCNKGLTLRTLGRFDEAMHCLDSAIEADRSAALAWLQRAHCLSDMGKLDDAEESYDQALSLDSRLANAWFGKARALERRGRLDEARRCLERAVALQPRNEEIQGALSRVTLLAEVGGVAGLLRGLEIDSEEAIDVVAEQDVVWEIESLLARDYELERTRSQVTLSSVSGVGTSLVITSAVSFRRVGESSYSRWEGEQRAIG